MSLKQLLAAAGLAVVALAGCGIDPGIHVERPSGGPTPSPSTSRTATGRSSGIDGMRVLREDPGAGRRVTAGIARCEGGRYPVSTDEISLDGSDVHVSLLAVNVMTCPGRSCGYEGTRGVYVYRLAGGAAGERVYADESAGSWIKVQDGALLLVRPEYRPDDAATCPTATRSTPLRWTGERLVEEGA